MLSGDLQSGQNDLGEDRVMDLSFLIFGSRYISIEQKLPMQAPKHPINTNSAINF